MLGKAETARRGNMVSAIGMLIAVAITLFDKKVLDCTDPLSWGLLIGGIVFGALVGALVAKKVKMTAMPEMVALLNGFGGLASLLVAFGEFQFDMDANKAPELFSKCAIAATILIGAITFTGSVYAWGKLSGKLSGKPKVYIGQKAVNAIVALLAVASAVAFAVVCDFDLGYKLMIAATVFSLFLGIFAVMPIGGGDMPVVISLLNSLSGMAASAAGFVISNNVLIVAGCLVGASGLILTVIMCKSMNRTLSNVLFSGFGAAGSKSQKVEGEMKPISTDDAYFVLEAAQNVVFIPGYGMAVAQAQHAVKELAEILENNGAEVAFAIHPVAGRMPGHMNVLLAEADVPYEQLKEMEEANRILEMADVAIVIGANDVVNPAAAEDKGSPIYGMPIIEAFKAKTVFALKRGKGAGFSGLENGLFFRPNTRMIYGDAKATINDLVAKFKDK
jgi:NAD(P) transhydrogenase subunit beta